MGHYHITMATVSGRRLLTSEEADKTTLELQLSWSKEEVRGRSHQYTTISLHFLLQTLSYEPGDAVCVVCPNDSSEVDYLVNRYHKEKEVVKKIMIATSTPVVVTLQYSANHSLLINLHYLLLFLKYKKWKLVVHA